MKKIVKISGQIGGYIVSLGLPFTHLFGYLGLLISLPAQFQQRYFKKYISILRPILLFIIYVSVLSVFQSNKIMAFKSVLNLIANCLLPMALGLSLETDARKFLKIYIISLTFLILLGFGSALGVLPSQIFGDKIWSEGMLWCFHHHNALASVLVIAIPIAAGIGGIFNISAITLFAGLILTGSRGYFLTIPLVIIGVIVAQFHRKKYWKKSVIIFLVIILIIFFVISFSSRAKERIGSIFNGGWQKDFSAESRFGFWQIGLWAFEENPVFGIGPGQLATRENFIDKLARSGLKIDAKSGEIKHLHNFYLTVLAETGIIGLLLFLWIIYAIAKKLWQSDRLGKIFIWGYFAFLIGNFFDSQFRGPTGAIELFFLSGLIIGQHNFNRTEQEKIPKNKKGTTTKLSQ